MRSPFTGLRFARLEFSNMHASGWVLFSICAIALIPLVYAGLFLLAFLDPYGGLVNVPAAVVNQDKGAIIQEEEVNIGQDLCDKLVENNENRVEGQATGYDWHFVSEDEARKGLESGEYYMELIIPENFSSNVASADSDDPTAAELQVYFNPSTNLIATTVGQSMVTKIKSELTTEISESYFDNIFLNISDAADSLTTAVDGTAELSNGLGDAADGSSELASGLNKLESGSSSLTEGLETAETGSKSLSKGISDAKDGSSKVTKGLESLSSGASAVDDGVDQVAGGLKQLKDGIETASSSSATLAQAITGVGNALQAFAQTQDASYLTTAVTLAQKVKDANPTIGNDLYSYVTGLSSSLQAYQSAAYASGAKKAEMATAKNSMDQALVQVQVSQNALTAAVSSVYNASAGTGSMVTLGQAAASYAAAAQAINPEDPTTYGSAISAANSLAQAAGTITSQSSSNGSVAYMLGVLQQFSTDLTAYQTAAGNYQALANEYQTLATTEATAGAAVSEAQGKVTGYLMGVKNTSAATSESTTQMATAINQLYTAVSGDLKSGTAALASGADQLYKGSNQLTIGLGSAKSGAKQLSSGITSAKNGSSQITDGLESAADGAATLSDGLDSAVEGADELHEGLAEGQEEMASSVDNRGQKVEMMAEPVKANGDQGTGSTITQVNNYGTGFAPYFIGLGMWVGALMITFLVRSLNNRILMSHASSVSAVLASYLPMVGIAFLQIAILLVFIQFGLKFNVNFVPQYYLFGFLVALCFIAIVQFFRAAFGTPGMVIIVILLMLQLCTAAGTFPIEAEIPFFNVLNPFLPMTYVVKGFRMAMCGLSVDQMIMPAVVLAGFTVLFLFLSTLVAHSKRKASMSTLYPKIQMVSQ